MSDPDIEKTSLSISHLKLSKVRKNLYFILNNLDPMSYTGMFWKHTKMLYIDS